MSSHHAVAGFGNPLLDMSVTVKETLRNIMTKFNLSPDGQKEVNGEDLNEIIALIKRANFEISYNAGGCVLNTLRIIQAMVQQPASCVFFGGLGNDGHGQLLESEVMKSGVEARYARQPSQPTGRVVALINGHSRSLVAHLGAAQYYSLADFQTKENVKLFKELSVVYIEGFFITHSFNVAQEVTRLSKSHGVAVVLNISGVYVAENCPKELLAMASAADIVIGNLNEFKALAKVMGLTSDNVVGLATIVYSKLWKLDPSQKFKLEVMEQIGKTLVITQGEDPVHCVYGGGSILTFDVPLMNPIQVIDTTGAGDAFVAGFITALLQNSSVYECLENGCELAQQIVQHKGVQPDKLINFLSC